MPEGDSVYRLAARLRERLDGKTVLDGELRGGAAAGSSLAGLRILEHETHGKHLLTRFDGGLTLHSHLRLSGSWSVTGPGKVLPRRMQPDVRIRMNMDDGATAWGVEIPVIEMLDTKNEDRVIGHLGPDPLHADWDAAEAKRRLLADPKRMVASALLDQRCVAGFGNLWANELCFLRGISPWTPIDDVDVGALLVLGARALRASATMQGMHQVTTGRARRRDEQHWVAGRAHKPCLRCGAAIRVQAEAHAGSYSVGVSGERRAVVEDQRRTWWCPNCQPGPAPS